MIIEALVYIWFFDLIYNVVVINLMIELNSFETEKFSCMQTRNVACNAHLYLKRLSGLQLDLPVVLRIYTHHSYSKCFMHFAKWHVLGTGTIKVN